MWSSGTRCRSARPTRCSSAASLSPLPVLRGRVRVGAYLSSAPEAPPPLPSPGVPGEGGSGTAAPKVSVVMTVFNAERYLREAIESVLNQTFGDFEFVIVDDGSTDRSLDILKEYAQRDPRIRLISRENKGIVASANEGIAVARGQYLARMDADDVSLPQRFE